MSASAWARSARKPLRRPLKVFFGKEGDHVDVDDAGRSGEDGQFGVGGCAWRDDHGFELLPIGREAGEAVFGEFFAGQVLELDHEVAGVAGAAAGVEGYIVRVARREWDAVEAAVDGSVTGVAAARRCECEGSVCCWR